MEYIITTSFIVFAIWFSFREGEIFGRIHQLLWGIPEWMKQPLFECPVCMTPYYGSAFYWIFIGNSIAEWIVTVIAAMGLNAIIVFIKESNDE